MASKAADGHVTIPTPVEVYFHWIARAATFIFKPIAAALSFVVRRLILAVVWFVATVYQPLAFLLQPVFYLGHFIFAVLASPFRLLAKFETIYIYLGVAALVGLAGGLIFFFLYETLYNVLGLGPGPKQPPQPPRDARQYREEKKQQLQQQQKGGLAALVSDTASSASASEAALLANGYLDSSDSNKAGSSRRSGKKSRSLLAQTIMEEEDSDF